MKPFKIQTIFIFSCNRKHINEIQSTFIGGMFEDLQITYGLSNERINEIHNKNGTQANKKSLDTKNCRVVYTLSTTIQNISLKSITVDKIENYQNRFKTTLFNRLSNVKKDLSEINYKTEITFTNDNLKLR